MKKLLIIMFFILLAALSVWSVTAIIAGYLAGLLMLLLVLLLMLLLVLFIGINAAKVSSELCEGFRDIPNDGESYHRVGCKYNRCIDRVRLSKY